MLRRPANFTIFQKGPWVQLGHIELCLQDYCQQDFRKILSYVAAGVSDQEYWAKGGLSMLDQISLQKNIWKKDIYRCLRKLKRNKKRKDEIELKDAKNHVYRQILARPFADTTIQVLSKKFLWEGNEATFSLNLEKKK